MCNTNIEIDWKRYWIPVDSSVKEFSYLPDDDMMLFPEQDPKHRSENVSTLDELDDFHFLGLIGEAGMGKSSELIKYEADHPFNDDETILYLYMDLKSVSSDMYLNNKIVESTPFKKWKEDSSKKLYIFFDSLDECLIRLDTATDIIENIIKENSVMKDSLFVRIVCRSSVWPMSFQKEMAKIWPSASCQTKKLASLSRTDIIKAANAFGLSDADEFLDQILQNRADAFADTPQKLFFLIKYFKKEKRIPKNRRKLYESGIEYLCSEHNESYLQKGYTCPWQFDDQQERLSYIAMLTNLSNCNSICLDTTKSKELNNIDFDLIFIAKQENNKAEARDKYSKFIFGTPLFSSENITNVMWKHRSYEEFLAAKYITDNQIPFEQIRTIITHETGNIVPSFAGLASWLISLSSNFAKEFIDLEPLILLDADPDSLNHETREKLSNILIEKYINKDNIIYPDWRKTNYRNLKYSGLEQKLLNVIKDVSVDEPTKRIMLKMVRNTDSKGISKDLLDIAKVKKLGISYDFRCSLVSAVLNLGDKATFKEMEYFIDLQKDEDPELQLKTMALYALWPTHISTEKLFGYIQPNEANLNADNLWFTMSFQMLNRFKYEDILVALEWIRSLQSWNYINMHWFVSMLLIKALENMDKPGIRTAIGKAFADRLCLSNGLDLVLETKITNYFEEHENDRHEVISATIEYLNCQNFEENFDYLSFQKFLYTNDIDWCLGKYKSAKDEKNRILWAYVIEKSFRLFDSKVKSKIFDVIKDDESVVHMFDSYTPEKLVERDAYLEKIRQEQERKKEEELKKYEHNDPERIVEKCLNTIESGDVEFWAELTKQLKRKNATAGEAGIVYVDITRMPGWENSNTDRKQRIINAAFKFIMEAQSQYEKWLSNPTAGFETLSVAQAFYLLACYENNLLDKIEPQYWESWAYAIIKGIKYEGSTETIEELVNKCLMHAEANTLKVIEIILDQEKESIYKQQQKNSTQVKTKISSELEQLEDDKLFLGYGNFSVLSIFYKVYNAQILDLIAAKIKDKSYDPDKQGRLLKYYFKRAYSKTIFEYALSLIEYESHQSTKDFQRAIYASLVLLSVKPLESWSNISQRIEKDKEFSKTLLVNVFKGEDEGYLDTALNKCSEKQISEIYRWMNEVNPVFAPKRQKHSIDENEEFERFKSSVIRALVDRKTKEAIEQLEGIARDFGGDGTIKYHLATAKRLMYAETHELPSPEEISKLLLEKENRIINSSGDLQMAVMEALERIQIRLRDPNNARVEDFWNDEMSSEKCRRHKDERTFSRIVAYELKTELNTDNLIVNREVELNARFDLDILAEIKREGKIDPIQVFIECKGCWYGELKTRMEKQLVGQYLTSDNKRHGIYLIGWYHCPDMCKDKNVHNHDKDIKSTKEFFTKQAKDLSTKYNKVIKSFVMDVSLPTKNT